MNIEKKQAYLHYLKKFVTAARQEKIKEVLALRTRYLTVALEDIAQSQNAAAVMRTCEALGLQDMYAIELEHTIDIKTKVARGAVQWMNFYRYPVKKYPDPTIACIKDLQQKGYRVVATSPHATTKISELPLDQKIALVFGTETTGLSQEALAAADERIALPQFGFVESFNVSVSVALCLYELSTRLRKSAIAWQLTPEEQAEIELEWHEQSVERPELLKATFLEQFKG